MPVMAKKRPEPKPTESDSSADAIQKPTSVRLSPTLAIALQRYIDGQKWQPSVSQVIERSLEVFLTREGFWPPPDANDS